MVPWKEIAGGVLGGVASLTGPDPYGGKEFDFMTDSDERRRHGQRALGTLGDMASGDQPLVSQANIRQITGPMEARYEATARAARQRVGERSINRGQGSQSGMTEASLADIDRQLLDAKRQQMAEISGKLALQSPQYRLMALQTMLPFLNDQEQMALGEHGRMEGLRAGQAAFGSDLHRFLGGAAAGLSGGGGAPWSFGGGGGGGGGRSPYPAQTRPMPYPTDELGGFM